MGTFSRKVPPRCHFAEVVLRTLLLPAHSMLFTMGSLSDAGRHRHPTSLGMAEAGMSHDDVNLDDYQPPVQKRVYSIRTPRNGARRDVSLKSKKKWCRTLEKVEEGVHADVGSLCEEGRRLEGY